MPYLPPVVEEFVARAADFIEPVREMAAVARDAAEANAELLASIEAVNTAMDGGAGDAARAAAADAALAAGAHDATEANAGLAEILAVLRHELPDISADLMMQTELLRGMGDAAAGAAAADLALAAAAERVADAAARQATVNVALGASSAAANRAAGGYFSLWSVLNKITSYEMPLFGGALNSVLPPLLAVATGTHLIADALVETAAVVIPAAIAFTAFGIAGAGAASDIYTQMKNVLTVSTATGQSIYPLTGGFSKLADSVRPEVYQLFGEALNVAAHSTGTFGALATGAGQALDQLAARFEVAITSGKGLGGIMDSASADLAGLGNVIGNIGGIIGNFMKVMPGYAEVLLSFAGQVTHLAESFTALGPVQGALGAFLALHGALLYAGIGVTALSKMIPGMLGGISSLALKGAVAADSARVLGGAGQAAGAGLLGLAGGAEAAAGLPWGWILTAAAGIGVLTYAILTAKDATQQWLGSMQHTITSAKTVTQGMADINSASIQVASQLADAQRKLGDTQKYVTISGGQAAGEVRAMSGAYIAAQNRVNDLTSGQRQLADETSLYNYRVMALARTYGSTAAATGMLVAAGVPMSLMLNKSSSAWAQVQAEVEAASRAYRAMGQTGGVLGADMSVLNTEADSQYQAMTNLNKAWSTFLGLSQQLIGGEDAVIAGMRHLATDAGKARASFTGVNAASLALRNDFEQMVPQVQGVIGGMRQGGASARQMASVLATDLKPAVDAGALSNAGLKQQIYGMARQAGYTGPDAIGPLTRYIDSNAGSLRHAAAVADHYAATLNHLAGQALTTTRAVHTLADAINALHDKTVVINVVQHGGLNIPGGGPRAITARQSGGPVAENVPYLVGEAGREIFVPDRPGVILPNPVTERAVAPSAVSAPPGPAELHSHIVVQLDGEKLWEGQQRQTLRYNMRNGRFQSGAWAPHRP